MPSDIEVCFSEDFRGETFVSKKTLVAKEESILEQDENSRGIDRELM